MIGAAGSAKRLIGFVIHRSLLLGGTFLLWHSGTTAMRFSEFDVKYLTIGGLLLVFGIFASRSGSDKPT